MLERLFQPYKLWQPPVTASAGVEAETTTLLAAMTSSPDASHQGYINTLIAALKTAGVWSKLDWFWVPLGDEHDTLLNWKNPAQTSTNVSSVSFSSYSGFTANGTIQYISSGFNPSTAGGNFAQNSACMFAWGTKTAQDVSGTMGAPNDALAGYVIVPRFSDDNFYGRINSTNYDSASNAAGNAGLFLLSRTASTGYVVYRNGASFATMTETSIALGNVTLGWMKHASVIPSHSGLVRAGGFGAGLTSTEQSDLYNALNTYLGAI